MTERCPTCGQPMGFRAHKEGHLYQDNAAAARPKNVVVWTNGAANACAQMPSFSWFVVNNAGAAQ